MAFYQVSEVLKKSILRSGDPPSLLALQTRFHFPEVLREVFPQKKFAPDLKKIKAKTLSWGTLSVSVPSSVWAQELRLKEKQIADLLNKKVGTKNTIKRFRLRVSVQ